MATPATTTTAPEAPRQLAFFGPKRYVRTTGPKDVYTATVTVPAWFRSPMRLYVQNGEADGTFRVSSATVEINGVEILTQSDFKQPAASFERTVTLTPTTTLKVTLASQPTSYLTFWLYGTVADLTKPQLVWTAPANASTIDTGTPQLRVRYEDAAGATEPAASGVDLASLRVLIDDFDRSALFTRRSDEASADIPADAPLAEGVHTYKASISDRAGNKTEVTGSFRVDRTPPVVRFTQPAAGAYLATRTPAAAVQYSDDVALDLASFAVQVNGAALPASRIVATATGATISVDALPEGPNQLVATIRDAGGNESTASIAFNVDVTAPVLTIAQPLEGWRSGRRDVPVTLTFTDEQGIAESTATASIDGTPVVLTPGSGQATAQLTALTDGAHTLTASIKDLAGNTTTGSSTFRVDVTLPSIAVIKPPAGANTKDSTPDVEIRYGDEQGVVTDSLAVKINDVDQTPLFTKTAEAATAAIATPLPEGTNKIAAQIRDLTDNVGSTVSSFRVDTIAPTGTIAAPAARVNSATPAITVEYADSGSGIDPETVALKLDGAVAAGVLVAGPDSASGAPAAQTDGQHAVEITFADRAGNATTLTRSFVIDTRAPVVTIDAPADDSFVRTTTPAIVAKLSDVGGTGVDTASVRLFLRRGDGAETDVTSYATVTSGDARGVVPATAPLEDGTYHLRVEVRDLAGNVTSAESAFEVDTLAPAYVIEAPAENGYVATHTPAIIIRWSDALSGVDVTRAAVSVDGVDRTALFTFTGAGATATLTAAQSLADGRHSIAVVLYDRAGNQAPPASHSFTIDTVKPVAAIAQPLDGSFIAAAPHAFAMTFADGSGSGIDPASVRVTIDGVDRTAEFTITPTGASAQIATPLADGAHTVALSVLDWAANPAGATSAFTVDSTRPVVTISAPAAGVWVKTAAVTVTGTVADASPVTLEINGLPFVVTGGAFTASVPTTDGAFKIRASARDAAANVGVAEVTINVDTKLPVIAVAEPADGLITAAASVRVAGTVTDASAITMTLDGQPLPVTAANAFAADVPLTADGKKTLTLTATDAGGNVATKTLSVTRDTIAPTVTVTSPVAASVVGTSPVVVLGTFEDATATTITVDGTAATLSGSAWQASIAGLTDGPHTFAIVARDAAGNTTTLSHAITLDTAAPVVSITTPANGTLTRLATTAVTGTVTDHTLRLVTARGVTATLTAGATANEKLFKLDEVALTEGDNTIVVIAIDALDRTRQATVMVTRDSIPPTVTVDAPQGITRTRATNVTANVQDNLAVRDVVFALNGTTLATLTAPPFIVAVTAPATSAPGDLFTLTVTARDTAGHSTTVTVPLRVTSDGAITGQVLSDATGHPLAGARVRIAGSAAAVTTDDRGRYALPASDPNLVLVIDHDDMTAVERNVTVESAVGTVPVDARLTRLANRTTIGASGGTLSNGAVSVTIPGGAVSAATPMRLTLLSPQGLPNLLPLGWSPLRAFELRVEGTALNVPFPARLSEITVSPALLVRYSTALHAWTVVATGVHASGGVADVTLPEPGAYALVVADGASVPAAVLNEVLKGVAMQPIGAQATSTGSVNPPTLPPTGGSATGTLVVHSPEPLPSGTVVQAEVTETFSLTSGEEASAETRTQDIILYRASQQGSDVGASFPIVPSRTFTSGDLQDGKVHLDILAGRESVRGKTGGSQALAIDAGEVTVTIPAGSLPQDLAISATPAILSSFLPSTANAVPFAEVVLDFGGASLGTSAELAVNASAVPAGESVVVARVERVRGVPKVVVVATTQVAGGRFVTTSAPGFDGIRRDGRYVFYRINVPWGVVSGTVGFSASLGAAIVTTDGFPFAALTDAQGRYTTIARSGTRTISATVPATSMSGQTSVSVPAGGTAAASFTLAATATTAVVTPENGAIRVPTSVQVEIAATAPFDPQTANSGTVRLRNEATSVPVRYVFSGSGRILAVIPQTALDAGQTYRLTVDGLADVFGGRVNVAEVSFTTMPDEAPQYDTNRIVFSMPDSGGVVTVSAPAGSLPPGTRVIVLNSGNGIVASFTVGNDGSFSGRIPATIDDRLLITVTDPDGNVVNFERSKFEFNDGTGRVAIGTGGGTVTGPGGVELRIPEGALESGAVFKVEALGPDAFPQRPDLPGANFGSGLRITSEQKPTLKHEGDLVFPRPADAPPGAFFYVYRRMTGPNGQVAFETVDHAFDDGHGKVVTASFPFIGWNDSAAAWHTAADAGGVGFGLASQIVFAMMWTFDAMLPGLPLPGAIIGKVYRPVWKAGATEPDYEPVPGAMVQVVRGSPEITNFARSQADGTFSLFDPAYRGGPVEVEARGPEANDFVRGTAFQANVANTRSNAFAAVEKLYGYAAEINFTFPATSQPRVSAVRTHVMKLDGQGRRQDAGGIVIAGTPLIIGFKFEDASAQPFMQNASVLGQEIPVRADATGDPLRMDYVLSGEYTPPQPGSYTIRATAIPPLGGSPLTITHTFLVVAAGGSNATTLNGAPPDIVTDLVDPRPDSIGNATSVFPTIVFTEPVKRVAANVRLTGDDGDVPVIVSAIGVDAQGNQQVIPDLAAQSAETAVTSITIQPRSNLKFGTQYTIRLDGGIVDLDKTAANADDPHPLKDAPRSFAFTTLRPEVLGGSAQAFSSLGVVALGDRVYTVENSSPHGKIRVFDIGTDPASPAQVAETYLSGMPAHIAGENESAATGGRVIAALSTLMLLRGPSNLWIYDASTDMPQRIGAVSLTEGTEQGIALRVAVKGRYAYAWTFPMGLRVIDLVKARQVFAQWNNDPNMRTRMYGDLVTAGRGFGSEAIVNTIAVPSPTGGTAHIFGLKVDDYFMDGVSQPLMIATGSLPLVVANPQTMQSWRYESFSGPNGISLTWGWSVALARVADKPVAVVVGKGTARDGGEWVVATVDLSNPRDAKLLGTLKLSAQPLDVVVKDNLALIAAGDRIVTVNIGDLANPTHAGDIPNVGGRLALADGGILVSTASGASTAGLRTAALGSFAVIHSISPVTLDAEGRTDEEMTIEYQIIAPPPNLATAKINIAVGGTGAPLTARSRVGTTDAAPVNVASVSLPNITAGRHSVVVPAGLQFNPTGQMVKMTVKGKNNRPAAPLVVQRKTVQRAAACSVPLVNPRPPASALSIPDALTDGEATTNALGEEWMSPSTVLRGSGLATITLAPQFIGSNAQVFLRSLTGEWVHTNVVDSGGVRTFALPAALTATPGLILVSATAGVDESAPPLPLLIVDPTLPALDTARNFGAFNAELIRNEGGTPVKIHVWGYDLLPGMKLVLGSGGTAAFELTTSVLTADSVEAVIPPPTLGRSSQLFVAILAADRATMSNAVPLEPLGEAFGASEDSGDGEEVQHPLQGYGPDDVEMTDVEYASPGLLIVRGVGLVEGGEVTFEVTDRNGEVRRATSTIEGVVPVETFNPGTTTLSGGLRTNAGEEPIVEMRGSVSAHLPPENIPTAKLQGADDTGRLVVTSAVQVVPTEDEITITFGGSYPFGVYKLKNPPTGRDPRFIFRECDADTTKYELVPGQAAQIQIAQAAYPQLRRETERNAAGVVHIRGIGLSTSLDDQPVRRALSELFLTGDSTVRRKIRVQDASLGSPKQVISHPATTDLKCLLPPVPNQPKFYSVDCLINKYSDLHQLLPQVVKGQVSKEAGFGDAFLNYRHEPSTIDLQNLSGDGAGTMRGNEKRIMAANGPHSLYRIPGKYLTNTTTPPETFTAGQALILTKTPKRLNGYVTTLTPEKKGGRDTLPNRLEMLPAVIATITPPRDPKVPNLVAVHCDKILRRRHIGTVDLPAETVGRNEFCVDYSARKITLGVPLQGTETLTVRYRPVSYVEVAEAGAMIASPLSTIYGTMTADKILADRRLVRGTSYYRSDDPKFLVWRQGDSLGEHFWRNITKEHGLVKPELYSTMNLLSFLAATTADSNHEFKVSATSQPTRVRDPKLEHATAQFWAAASYGPLQMTFGVWERDDIPGVMGALARRFALVGDEKKNIVELLWDYPTGLELGMIFDKHIYLKNPAASPNSISLGDAWWNALKVYNGKAEYASEVMKRTGWYEPK